MSDKPNVALCQAAIVSEGSQRAAARALGVSLGYLQRRLYHGDPRKGTNPYTRLQAELSQEVERRQEAEGALRQIANDSGFGAHNRMRSIRPRRPPCTSVIGRGAMTAIFCWLGLHRRYRLNGGRTYWSTCKWCGKTIR